LQQLSCLVDLVKPAWFDSNHSHAEQCDYGRYCDRGKFFTIVVAVMRGMKKAGM
jgi:hypothetical protein